MTSTEVVLLAALGVLAAPLLSRVAPSYDLHPSRFDAVLAGVSGVLLVGFLAYRLPPELAPVAVGLGIASPALFYIDLIKRKLPDRVVLPLLALCAVTVLAAGIRVDGSAAVRGFVVSAVFFFVFYLIGIASNGIGFGDVKLLAVLGLPLGYLGYLVAYFAFLAFAIVGGLHVLVARARFNSRLAYGPSILIGSTIALLIGIPVTDAVFGSVSLVL